MVPDTHGQEQKNHELEEKVQIRTAELRKVNEMLHQSSMTDELTGISNRRFAMEELDRNIYKFQRYQTPFSILFIDLNKFKEVDEGKEEEIPPTYSTFIQHYFHTEPNEKAASPDGVGASQNKWVLMDILKNMEFRRRFSLIGQKPGQFEA